MTTYVYETIPAHEGEQPRQYEIRQSMKDAPLTAHPETGEPIRRVIKGGFGLMTKAPASSAPAAPRAHSCCGPSCGCI